MDHWLKVRDSGDPEAISHFCAILEEHHRINEIPDLKHIIENLNKAAQDFDLDRILILSHKINTLISGTEK